MQLHGERSTPCVTNIDQIGRSLDKNAFPMLT